MTAKHTTPAIPTPVRERDASDALVDAELRRHREQAERSPAELQKKTSRGPYRCRVCGRRGHTVCTEVR